MQSQ